MLASLFKKRPLQSYAATLSSWWRWLQFHVSQWPGSTPVPQTAAICTIALQEECYIDEWIQYHLKLGFDHIYVYDNDPAHPLKDLALRYPGRVTVTPFPGALKQLSSYYHFVVHFRHQHSWAAFIDVDEFIVLRQHAHIVDLLRQHCSRGALGLHWVFFDSNDHLHYIARPVLERFTRRHPRVSSTVKVIAYLPDLLRINNPHTAMLATRHTRDCHGNLITGHAGPQPNEDIACLYHYFTKSAEEFRQKCARGQADVAGKRDFSHDFERHNRGSVQDRSALEFFLGPVSEAPSS